MRGVVSLPWVVEAWNRGRYTPWPTSGTLFGAPENSDAFSGGARPGRAFLLFGKRKPAWARIVARDVELRKGKEEAMKRRISEASSRLFVVIVMASVSILLTGGVWAAGGNLFWEDQSDKGQGKRVFAAGSGNISRPLQVAFAEAPVKPGGNPSGVGADCTNPPNLGPGADLVNCDLLLAPLRGAKLRGANLTGADLRGAIMYNADLREANLTDADLGFATLTGANLTGATLTKANLIFARLGANLVGANLRDANLTDADLAFANLTGATVTGANLTGADLRGANLTDANVAKVRFGNTTCPDGTNSDDPDGDRGTCLNNL